MLQRYILMMLLTVVTISVCMPMRSYYLTYVFITCPAICWWAVTVNVLHGLSLCKGCIWVPFIFMNSTIVPGIQVWMYEWNQSPSFVRSIVLAYFNPKNKYCYINILENVDIGRERELLNFKYFIFLFKLFLTIWFYSPWNFVMCSM